MKARFNENTWRSDGGAPEGRPFSATLARFGAFGTNIHINIWEQGRVLVTLTTQSSASHSGIPVLRVKHPAYEDSLDLGPADFAPCGEDEPPRRAAELLVHIHAKRPLTGGALDGARRFLSQWPDGPQLPEEGGVLVTDRSPHRQHRPECPPA
jgi:hypothetical protein